MKGSGIYSNFSAKDCYNSGSHMKRCDEEGVCATCGEGPYNPSAFEDPEVQFVVDEIIIDDFNKKLVDENQRLQLLLEEANNIPDRKESLAKTRNLAKLAMTLEFGRRLFMNYAFTGKVSVDSFKDEDDEPPPSTVDYSKNNVH